MNLPQEVLGRLPANNRLFLVRNIQKIATVDFISELPDELSLSVLRYLDPNSLVSATQVCSVLSPCSTSFMLFLYLI